MGDDKRRRPLPEGSIVMPSGHTLSWKFNKAGGRIYYSDELGFGPLEIWDTCLVYESTLMLALWIEEELSKPSASLDAQEEK